ncbi:MAG: hypothetical protein A3J93_01385 [Candidatus Magasanikbacteria bacterium RIFOXYC2_FULL_42_28]|uniref:Uncharacterized protein n=1 Tax=Candidatus Magasanikbacteria bacterium RIFOXYC2_FULL_42_28 TaxID=1798704 RepID=A0A1F6NXW6_9BACT|nr:MAG: hypothetical protein A3J93_01385 [Candidatus Magasanikbacteria bacterium RIFOXYC2_FULL_42_28]
MFKHKNTVEKTVATSAPVILSETKDPLTQTVRDSSVATLPQNDKKPPASEADLRELIEKNLKWSQIIYEQNRKINRKLRWSAVAGWLRLALIVVPIILALWFLPPYLGQFKEVFENITGANVSGDKPNYSLEQLMQLLPIGEAEKEQLKTLLK